MKLKIFFATATLCASLSIPAFADDNHGLGPIRADGHAPIGVMGEHMHKMGEVMLSYRFMHMDMEGSRIGTQSASDADILATPNRFFGQPMQPPGLRVIPTSMTMDMHMFGAMYAPSDDLTLMVMANYIEKEMDHTTYNPMGTAVIGGFTTKTKGFGDTKISGLIRVYDDGAHKLHLTAGLSLPTGSITETGAILTPIGGTPTVRLPYAMQLGSGTFDLLPAITYAGFGEQFAWGGQMSGVLRLGENDQHYTLGDEFQATAWLSYMPAPWISFSGRAIGSSKDKIDGIDPKIVAPVQTADPENYGGRTVELGLGVNLVGQSGWLRGHRIAAEYLLPVHRNLNGPQMETDWTLTVGYQYAF